MRENEQTEVVMRFRTSVLNYLPFFLAPFYFLLFAPVFPSIAFVFWLGEVLVLGFVFFMIFAKEYTLTNKDFCVKSLFSPKEQKVDLEEIKEIDVVQKIFYQYWFRTGNVIIETHRPDGLKLCLVGIENPEFFKSFVYSMRKL